MRTDIAPYLELEQALISKGRRPPSLAACRTIDEVLERCGAVYLTDGLTSLKSVAAASVDLIFSQAVLEHVRRHHFLETMRECRRIVKPGGISSHQVDLRDHLGGALNNLRFSERVWESEFFAGSGFYTNRIPFGEMPRLFREAGFAVEVTAVRRWAALPTPRNRLAEEFRGLPDDQLCVSGFEVVLR